MKVVIQIPCYNEESTLPISLSALPRKLDGVDSVEWLVIDDGSDDRTVDVARTHGVDHIISLPRHVGLATAFVAGLEASIKVGADIIVNTDADNQYFAGDIPKLIEPILRGRAQLVIGARPIAEIEHFSRWKRFLQRLGSGMIRVLSKTDVADAPSGFRAMSRSAAMQLNIFNKYSYTLESIIQAGQKRMAVMSVPVRVNAPLRSSRLIRSIPDYIRQQILIMLRIYITYRPLKFFVTLGVMFVTAGILVGLRFLYYFFTADAAGHVQSVILSGVLVVVGFFMAVAGVLADLISVNRQLLEKINWRVQLIESQLTNKSTNLE